MSYSGMTTTATVAADGATVSTPTQRGKFSVAIATYGCWFSMVAHMRDSGFFLAGWLTCAVMSGAILLLAVRTYVEEDQGDACSDQDDATDT